MPKVVDHDERRREIGRALRRVVARDGITGVSVRAVAKECGLPPSSLRYYFTTQDELLGFAVDQLVDDAVRRFGAAGSARDPRRAARDMLHRLLPLDAERRYETDVWFAFAARAAVDPALSAKRRVYDRLIRSAVDAAWRTLRDGGVALAGLDDRVEVLRLHALVDGLALHGSTASGLLTTRQQRAVLAAHLDSITRPTPDPVAH